MSFTIKQNTVANIPFLVLEDGEPVIGETIEVFISANGEEFHETHASNPTEIGRGWYYMPLDADETSELGFIILAAQYDSANVVIQVTE